jgi:hypothetical protein
MHETALAGCSRKEFFHRGQQSVMAIGDNQIDVGGSSSAQGLQQASPSLFVLIARRLVELTPLYSLPDRRLRRLK